MCWAKPKNVLMVTATSVARSSSTPDSRYSASMPYPAVGEAVVARMAVPTSVGRLAGSVRVSGERRDAVDQAERDRQVRQQHPR